jgi:molybdopterin-containing oxidoreductase family molybdopterin binding subunit
MPQSAELPNLRDLVGWPITTCFTPAALNDRDNFHFEYEPELLINYGSNLLMSAARPEVTFEAFKDAFVVCVNLFSDETAEALADIVLPDACYLERLDPVPNFLRHHHPVGLGSWGHTIRQPAVAPLGERRHFSEVVREIGDRLGLGATMNLLHNLYFGIEGEYALAPEAHYTWEEVADRVYKSYFGAERGLEHFRARGVVTWPKRVEEVFWKPFVHARAPLYNEWVVSAAREIRRIADERGMRGVHTHEFVPLPAWFPCRAAEPRPGFDLRAIYYRVPWHSFSATYQNPWLDEISQGEPYSYFIQIHAKTAGALGIRDGDVIELESTDGARVKGRARLTQGIHPEVLAVANNGGHWARGMPFARGKGVFFNQLLPMDLAHTDLVSLSMDCDARVRVRRA